MRFSLFAGVECFLKIACREFRQLLSGGILHVGQTVGLLLNALLEDVAGVAGVAKVGTLVRYGTIEAHPEVAFCVWGQGVLIVPGIHGEDVAQLGRGIVWEVDVAIEA